MRPILAAACLLLCSGLAAQADDASLAREVVAQVNWARQDPKAAAAELKSWLPRFEGGRYLAFPDEPELRTVEGVSAVKEAIAFLERQKPLPPVAWSDRLAKAASDLAKDQARHGGIGHQASDGSLPWDRIARYGTVSGSSGEVVTYGTFGNPGSPRRAVLVLIVDDGVPDRGHRKVLFDGAFTLAGAAWGPHPVYTRMALVDFASGFLRDLESRPQAPRRREWAMALVDELNRVRQDPAACAAELKAWLPHFKGRVLELPDEAPVETYEGPAAVEEAIALLEAAAPVPPVRWSNGLAGAAEELAASEAGSGAVGHEDDGLDLEARLSRHGAMGTPCGEAIAYGAFSGSGGPRRAMLSMIVADGAKARGVLKLLRDPGLQSAGAAWDAHPSYGSVVVLDAAGALRRRD